jgi:tetratricopeptide (TPR) repeat protein
MPRLEQIQSMLAAEPDDVFLNFSLAMEYAKQGRGEEALAQFTRLNEIHPDYVPAYFQKATTLVNLDRKAEAREALARGIEVAGRIGDHHAASEMEQMLSLLD